MKQTLKTKSKQSLLLTSELKQQIKLLAFSTSELRKFLLKHLIVPLEEENKKSISRFRKEQFLDNFTSKSFSIEHTEEETLKDCLLKQLDETISQGPEHLLGEYLIDSIEESGKLDAKIDLNDLKSIVYEEFKIIVSSNDIEKTIKKIQQMDPIGCCFRSTMETLIIQTEDLDIDLKDAEEIKKILLDVYKGKNTLDEISIELKKIIKGLNPEPGWAIGSNQDIYLKPEIEFIKKKSGWQAVLLDSVISNNLLKDIESIISLDKNQEKKKNAKHLLDGIKRRNRSLLVVSQFIAHHQSNFLDDKSNGIEPLLLKDIARELEFHESTISRLLAHKYIQIPGKIILLKSLLSKKIGSKIGTEILSTSMFKELLIKTIKEENTSKPISDQELSNLFKKEKKLFVSRRVISKYRKELNIPSSLGRKK
ncbi:MAG: hypothetical protein P8J93_04800 [SAR86 cluster bacterium]|nr:hypothetical protein [SAR86 cluster bacterium]